MNKHKLRKILAHEGLVVALHGTKRVASDHRPFLQALQKAGLTGLRLRRTAESFAGWVENVGYMAAEMAPVDTPKILDATDGTVYLNDDDMGFESPSLFEFTNSFHEPWEDAFEYSLVPKLRPSSKREMEQIAKAVFYDRSVLPVSEARAAQGAKEGMEGVSEDFKDAARDILIEREDWIDALPWGEYPRKDQDYDIQFHEPKVSEVKLTFGRKGITIEVKVQVELNYSHAWVKVEE